ncbi:MAG: L-ribulose-5-phosphate 4-epimerase AraD [Gemmatimonadales bacterium]|jgi:L-ribulose-5-phosphate 4-epimerase
MLEALKREVCSANRALVEHGLVKLTFGNVSGIDAERLHVVIKPSGVPYAELQAEHMVVVDLAGEVVEGALRPSTDTPTHVLLYRHFEAIGGITHVHSRYATMFAQARQEIPCLGTTHADVFHGPVPVTRPLSPDEVERGYEAATARVIEERFAQLDPEDVPGVLVAGHGPFTWGANAAASVEHAVALEVIAELAFGTRLIDPKAPDLERHVLDKHHERKHGTDAYYGQD